MAGVGVGVGVGVRNALTFSPSLQALRSIPDTTTFVSWRHGVPEFVGATLRAVTRKTRRSRGGGDRGKDFSHPRSVRMRMQRTADGRVTCEEREIWREARDGEADREMRGHRHGRNECSTVRKAQPGETHCRARDTRFSRENSRPARSPRALSE